MTPKLRPTDEAEQRYNRSHKKTRQCVERSFGLLKQWFRCIHRDGGNLTYSPSQCCKIVMTCMVLHNICVSANLPFDDEEDDPDDCDNANNANNAVDEGAIIGYNRDGAVQMRRQLAHNRFVNFIQ